MKTLNLFPVSHDASVHGQNIQRQFSNIAKTPSAASHIHFLRTRSVVSGEAHYGVEWRGGGGARHYGRGKT